MMTGVMFQDRLGEGGHHGRWTQFVSRLGLGDGEGEKKLGGHGDAGVRETVIVEPQAVGQLATVTRWPGSLQRQTV